jgi:hypothetical protein
MLLIPTMSFAGITPKTAPMTTLANPALTTWVRISNVRDITTVLARSALRWVSSLKSLAHELGA